MKEPPVLEAVDASKHYGAVQAVRNVSFRVNRGEILGLLGPNGAGKTTLLRMMTGYHYPSAGEIRVKGVDVCESPVATKRSIGYLPEQVPLYNELSVYEYLRFVAQAREIAKEHIVAKVEKAIGRCGLDEMRNRTIDTLSKGYKQRVGLAQSIVHEPEIMILDEPTSGLDPNQIAGIRSLILELGQEKTVILSTHILREVEAVCKRMIIINRGAIVAQGAKDEIAAELKGGNIIEATIKVPGKTKVPTKTDMKKEAERIPSLQRLHHANKREQTAEASVWDLKFSCGTEGGPEAVFDWAVRNNYKLLALNHNRYSLEEIFTKLTINDEAAP